MSIFNEMKQDATQAGAMIGAVLGFVALWFLWSIGTWLLILVALILLAGFVAYKYYSR